MQLYKSLTLLAALLSSAVAHADGHAHRHVHHARELSTVTLTTQRTVTFCPCDSSIISTSSIAPATSTSAPENTPTLEPTTSLASTTATTSSIPSATSSGTGDEWLDIPSDGVFSTAGFGGITKPYNLTAGDKDTYVGNIGSPYGSNIQEVSASEASSYKYVIQFKGSNTVDWTVKIWNKIGPDHKMDGWWGNACHSFTLAPGETRYWAFNTNTQGGFTAAEGSTIPLSSDGQYASTWGEFDFGDLDNYGCSGYDVSAITAVNSGKTIQGMKMSELIQSQKTSSYILPGAKNTKNAYLTEAPGGKGGNLPVGPVRIAVEIDYQG